MNKYTCKRTPRPTVTIRSEKLRTKYHHVSCEAAECEERGCSDLQKNKPAPTNESGKIIDCEASDSILDSTPLTTLQTKT